MNRAYLEKVAQLAKGRSYFLTDPSGLEQILIKDVMEHTGTTAIEKSITAAVAKHSPDPGRSSHGVGSASQGIREVHREARAPTRSSRSM